MNGIFIRIDEFLKGSTVTNLSGIRLIFNDSLLFTEECLEWYSILEEESRLSDDDRHGNYIGEIINRDSARHFDFTHVRIYARIVYVLLFVYSERLYEIIQLV